MSEEDLSKPEGALSGLRVLELGVLVAGPFCGQLLGDMGAEVIKIEPPGKPDPLREWGSVRPEDQSLWFASVNRNKKTITLNLREPEGQSLIRALVAKSDILVENFRPGTMEKWGLGYDALSEINPKLIMVRVSGYGQTGPYSHKAGYASVGEAMGGLRYVMGEPDRMPSRAGISIGDSLAGIYGCMGALAALEARHRTGRGQMVDSAIYEACLAMMESLVPDYQFGGHIRERTGSFLPKIAPSNIYEASDGMLIIAANQDTVFQRLCEAMGEPELSDDARYVDHIQRGKNQAELDERINDWSRQQTCADLEKICEASGVPCGRIYTAPDMLHDPHYKAREAITTVEHPVLGDFKTQNVTPRFSQTQAKIKWMGQAPGAFNNEVYSQLLELNPSKIAELKAAKII